MGMFEREKVLEWREIWWQRPMNASQAVERLTAVANDPQAPLVVLETRADAAGVRYLAGCRPAALAGTLRLLDVAAFARLDRARRLPATARQLRSSDRHQMLGCDNLPLSAAAILTALTNTATPKTGKGDELVIQLVLGARLAAVLPPATSPAPRSFLGVLAVPPWQESSGETHRMWAQKTSLPGFRAVVRLGVNAASPQRREQLLLSLFGALRRLETAAQHLNLTPVNPTRLGMGTTIRMPWRWASLNADEVAALAGLPVTANNTDELPGLPPLHPKPLPPLTAHARHHKSDVVIGVASAPGFTTPEIPLPRTSGALLRHTHIIGPTGTGKSVLMLNIALQDIAAGRSVVVIEPKGDLIRDLLARIPASRENDVVVLDPLAAHVVGLNPLAGNSPPELRADAVLSIFTDLFGHELGPRTTDILHASLLTLARQPQNEPVSLVQIPRLLTDPTFRIRLIGHIGTDVALSPFWAWYSSLRDTARDAAIAPLMNKLRAVILKPSIRRVIGQTQPKFHISQVFADHKILLIPLPIATLGAEGAKLLGSLAVSALWDAARQRALIPANQREPVSVMVDECQTFMSFATDLADALATSRSYGVGWSLAHQYLRQLTPELREAVLNNCRSHIVFQTSIEDATTFAKTTTEPAVLAPADFTTLPAFHVYASLFANNQTQPFTSGTTLPAPAPIRNPETLRRASTERYGRAAHHIETDFLPPADPPRDDHNPADMVSVGKRQRAHHPADQDASDHLTGRVKITDTKPAAEAPIPAGNTNASPADPDQQTPQRRQP